MLFRSLCEGNSQITALDLSKILYVSSLRRARASSWARRLRLRASPGRKRWPARDFRRRGSPCALGEWRHCAASGREVRGTEGERYAPATFFGSSDRPPTGSSAPVVRRVMQVGRAGQAGWTERAGWTGRTGRRPRALRGARLHPLALWCPYVLRRKIQKDFISRRT